MYFIIKDFQPNTFDIPCIYFKNFLKNELIDQHCFVVLKEIVFW